MDLKKELAGLLTQYCESEGTGDEGGIRDMLTDLMHLCDDLHINFPGRLDAATEVYDEELDGIRPFLHASKPNRS